MATDQTKQADPTGGVTDIAFESKLAELLNRADFGPRVKGMICAVGLPQTFTGKNQDGSAYVSISRRIELICGAAGAVVCGERVKSESEYVPLRVGQVVEWPILGAKTEGKQMVFRIKAS